MVLKSQKRFLMILKKNFLIYFFEKERSLLKLQEDLGNRLKKDYGVYDFC